MSIKIRKATQADFEQIWPIFKEVLLAGDTWPQLPTSTREENYSVWFREGVTSYVAIDGEEILGAYLLRANQPGLGSHVGNAGYIVSKNHRGKGVGELLGRHSLKTAKELGFYSLQFNLVVSSNTAGLALWKKIGFQIIATLPKAFRHLHLGPIDAYIMYQVL